LYLRSGLRDYLKDDCKMRERAVELVRQLKAFERAIEANGKRFVFIVAPDKATIYPEYVGFKRPANSCGKNFFDLLLEALAKDPLHNFIRLDKALLGAKKDALLYYPRGTHWNYRGALTASRIILERLTGPGMRLDIPPVDVIKATSVPDLAGTFSLGLAEKVDFPARAHWDGKVSIKECKPLPNRMSRLRITTTPGPGRPVLPPTIIYRDSFMITPLMLMAGSFKDLDALWTKNIPVGPKWDFSSIRESDIFIIEVVERMLPGLLLREKALIDALGGARFKRKAGKKFLVKQKGNL